MARTTEEQLAWERQCYGQTEAQMRDSLTHQAFVGWPMLAMSILSDAQEVIGRMEGLSPGKVDASMNVARQYMNKAKWIIGEHWAIPLRAAQNHDAKLNAEPNPQAPTGDDYNTLCILLGVKD